MRMCAVLASALLLAACGGKSPTGPDGQHPVFSVIINPLGNSYTASFNGQTYTGLPQNLQVRLAPGTYSVEGTFSGPAAAFTVTVASSEGSIVNGSFRATQAPSGTTVTACGVTMVNNSLGSGAIPFRIEFRTQSSASGACHVG